MSVRSGRKGKTMAGNVADKASLFCFGMGYCASALSARLGWESWRIVGTAREPDARPNILRFDRSHPLTGPFNNADSKRAGCTHLLVSIPPDEEGDPALGRHQAEIVEQARAGSLRWVG